MPLYTRFYDIKLRLLRIFSSLNIFKKPHFLGFLPKSIEPLRLSLSQLYQLKGINRGHRLLH